MKYLDIAKRDWSEILAKAGFAALYAGAAELTVTNTLDESTIYIALLCALLRAVSVFALTVKDETAKKPSVKKINAYTLKKVV